MINKEELTTDVYVVAEHKRDRKSPKLRFSGVLGKLLVSTLVLTTLTTATMPTFASTVSNYDVKATITTNYSQSVENVLYEIKQTVKVIEEMKVKGLVTDAILNKLTEQIMNLEQAVQVSGKAITEEVVDTVKQVEKVLKGVKGAESTTMLISVIKDTMGINVVVLPNNKATTTATSKSKIKFNDVNEGNWFYKDVMTLSGEGIISGVSAPVNGVGQFAPLKHLSLGEFLALATRLVANDYVKDIPNAGHWATKNYVAAIESGLISSKDFSGTADALNKGLSREDMAYILVEVARLNGETLTIKPGIQNNIKDFNSISRGRQNAVLMAFSNSLIVGDSNNNFNPKATLSRAETASVLCRVMGLTQRPVMVVKTAQREPMILRWDDPNRPLPIAGDTFIDKTGKATVLKEVNGILGYGQGINPFEGMKYGDRTLQNGDIGDVWNGDKTYLGQPFYICPVTGEGHFRGTWLDISSHEIREALKIENPKDGQKVGNWTVYSEEIGMWHWIGPR